MSDPLVSSDHQLSPLTSSPSSTSTSINAIDQLSNRVNELTEIIHQLLIERSQAATSSVPSMSSTHPTVAPSVLASPVVKDEPKFSSSIHHSNVGMNRSLTPHNHATGVATDSPSSSSVVVLGSSIRDFKLPDVSIFHGSVNDNATALRNWIVEMERYLEAKELDVHKPASLKYAALRLGSVASQWYEGIRIRDSTLIRCWFDLKTELKKEYEPVSLDQTEFNSLINLRYLPNMGIKAFNHKFRTHYQNLSLEYTSSHGDKFWIGVYQNAIQQHCPLYVQTILRQEITAGRITTLHMCMQQAILAEANNGGRHRGVVAAAGYSGSNHAHRNYQQSSNHGRFNNSPVTRQLFNTPARLHHMDAADDDYDWRSDDTEHGFDDSSTAAASAIEKTDTNGIILNAMEYYEKHGNRHRLTPKELDARRRSGVCFRCKSSSHIARNCPVNKPQHVNNIAAETGSESESEIDVNGMCDPSNVNDADGENRIFVNAMKYYGKFGKRHGLSPQELDRRRRNDTCFKCNGKGHYASQCHVNSSGSNVGLNHSQTSKKF